MTFFGDIGASFFWYGIGIIILTLLWYGCIGKYHETRHNWAGIIAGGTLLVIFGCLGLSWVEVQIRSILGGDREAAAILTIEILVTAILGGLTARLWRGANRQWTPPGRVIGSLALAGITHLGSALLLGNFAWGLFPTLMVGVVAGLFCSKWYRDRFARWREYRAASRAITPEPAEEDGSIDTQLDSNEGGRSVGEVQHVEEVGEDGARPLKDVAFWHAVVEVNRGPAMLVAAPSAYPEGRLPAEGQTWLAEYRRGDSHGLRITIKGGAKLEFFTRCDSEGEATEVAGTMLEELKHRFRGVHGKAFARAITNADLVQEKHKPYCELTLPAPPYEKGIAFVEKLVDIGRDIPDGVECTILWHRPSWGESNQSEKDITRGRVPKALAQQFGDSVARRLSGVELPRDLYMARIYITAQHMRTGSFDALLGHLSALKIGIANTKREGASWRVAPAGTHLNILKCRFRGGHPVAPTWGRFDFPDNLKLPRGFLLVSENFHARRGLRQNDPNYIILGDALVDGAPTRYLGHVAVNDLPTSGVFLGTSGTGKSTCLAHVVRQVVQKCPTVGILVINVGKAGEESHFPFAKVIRWDDADFSFPWFVRGAKHETACEQFAYILAAALGLKRPLPQVVQNALAWDGKDITQENSSPCTEVPVDFHAFVRKLRAYLRAYQYAPDTQADIVRMIDNRIARLDTPGFCSMTRLDHPNRFGWFRDWLEGRHVFLDLMGAPKFLMKFITFTIFQMIREAAPQAGGILRNLLVIDEAHVIFPRSTSSDPDDEQVIAANFMEELLGDYLDEFRSRGHALLLSNQEPVNLLPAAYDKPALKILFHLPAKSAELLLPTSPDRPILQRLPQHQAFVIDGATGQFYCIQTQPPLKGAEPDPSELEVARVQNLNKSLNLLEGKSDNTQTSKNPAVNTMVQGPSDLPVKKNDPVSQPGRHGSTINTNKSREMTSKKEEKLEKDLAGRGGNKTFPGVDIVLPIATKEDVYRAAGLQVQEKRNKKVKVLKKQTPQNPQITMDDLEVVLAARITQNSHVETSKAETEKEQSSLPEDPDEELDALARRIAALGSHCANPEIMLQTESQIEKPAREEKSTIPLSPPESPQPQDEPKRDSTLEGCANLILPHYNFVDPALATAPGQAFLDHVAKDYWNRGQPQVAYRFKYAQHHNLLHKAVYGYRNGPARVNFFTTAHAALSLLIQLRLPVDQGPQEELVAMQETHEYLLCAPKVDLNTFKQAIDVLRRVTQGLTAQLKNKIDQKGDAPTTAMLSIQTHVGAEILKQGAP